MFSRTGTYALRAIAHVARQNGGRLVGSQEIAEAGNIPPNYVSKILRELVRAGLLDSARGFGGGYRIAKPLEEIFVGDIIAPFDDVASRTQCPLRIADSDSQDVYPIDESWKPLADAYTNFVENVTLSDFVGNHAEPGLSVP